MKTHQRSFKFLLILVLVFLLIPNWLLYAQEKLEFISIRNDTEVQKIIDDYRERIPELLERDDLPGLSIALIDRDGAVWAEGFGFTDNTKKHPVDSETIFSIQSMSKTFTATGIMIAAQEGLLDLDAPIETYIPNFKIQTRFNENPLKTITIKHLLSHKAGFTHEAPVGNNYDASSPSLKTHVMSIQDSWLRYPVGTRYSYSNLGIDLAGYILQVVSGKPFEEYMKEKLFGPLGMVNSSFDVKVVEKNKNRAVGHSRSFEKVPLAIPMIPAGSVYSGSKEMAKFVQFHLNKGIVNGKVLLKEDYLDKMYTIPYPVKGQETGYSLGISKNYQTLKEKKITFYNHGGGGFGFLSIMTWYPELGIGVVILTNSVNHRGIHNSVATGILNSIIEFKTGESPSQISALQDVKKDQMDIDDEMLKKLSGTYIGRGSSIGMEIRDNIPGLKSGSFYSPLTFYSENEAFTKNYHYKFVMTSEGSPSYLVRIQDGTNWDYNEGDSDKPGPDKPEWDKYTGRYRYKQWGKRGGTYRVHKKNGYLYFNNLKLVEEFKPGLFFTSTGEALDFRSEVPTWRNIRLEKE